ncbi:penicillin acylase family protein [Mechercharimyces sp. CAU 1602]|uniref:penicillin acylase family protein n=1 Tax=Mechercharimyces sp. CAU 1602 TaxID=2973933 RepID=UPI002161B538|nr:penicillin acylase family protein [Mechercharimyces sp. CAU 1602]MCS1351076.1 penicillin acylase family protein [Mechercharimyces sp. CAU 1602]
MESTAAQVKPRWKRKRWRILSVSLITLLLVTGVPASYGYWVWQKSLPQIEGELQVEGLLQEVSVWRDTMGVPHIKAGNAHDLYFAQGFVTAQDRLFQMDLSRRQASGQLSEVIGEKTIERDKFFRTLGLRRAAEASAKIYSEETQGVVAAYAAGVNAYIQRAKEIDSLPVEFRLLGYEPKPWQVIDSITISKYMAYDLGGHWEGQAFRYYLLQNFSKEKAYDLFPSYPADADTIMEAIEDSPVDVMTSLPSVPIPSEWNGSNNWVIAGSKTSSGKPILANDPHLDLGTPSIWYETHLEAPDLEVAGVIFAGIPGILLGHNRHIAWGVTNVGPDVQDLYIEKRNPENPQEVKYMDKWEKIKIIEEKIKVKESNTIPHQVHITRHGPIISEFIDNDISDSAFSLRWTALDPSNEMEAVLRFNRAKNWDEFKEGLTLFHTPAQNFVFASIDGTIAYRANGLIPIRKKGDSMLPVPGWTNEYEWKGYIPWDKLPTLLNPDEGFIATANNKVIDDAYSFHISNTWADPYRYQRIAEELRSKNDWTVKENQALQLDSHNLRAKEMVPSLLVEINKKKKELRRIDQKALKILMEWNYEDSPKLGAPLLFHLWMDELEDQLYVDIDRKMMPLFERKGGITDQLLRQAVVGEPGPWITEQGGVTKLAMTSFKNAVDRAVELQGDSPAEWSWGEYHQVKFQHPLAAVEPLNYLFNPKSYPFRGSEVTVAAARYAKNGEVVHGASWRTVVDLNDLSRSWNVIGPGQVGHRLSPWYDTMVG